MRTTSTVSRYLLQRLNELGLQHTFGVPGDYVLDFMDRIVESPIELIGTCNELNAGYAADAYARLNGIGAAVVTYGVGAFSILNAVAGAYAEQVPLVLISGAPKSDQRKGRVRMHHLTSDYQLQLDIFERVTVGSALLSSAETAPRMIDRLLSQCITQKRPVYFEIPVDGVDSPCEAPEPIEFFQQPQSDPMSLEDSVEEAARMLNEAAKPIVLAGVELQRYGLIDAFQRFVEKTNIPFATSLDGKSLLSEDHPLFAGVYIGALSSEKIRDQLEECDCLLSLGVYLNDISTGGFTAHLPEHEAISAHGSQVQIASHFYRNVWLGDFLEKLAEKVKRHDYTRDRYPSSYEIDQPFEPQAETALTPSRFYDAISRQLDDQSILVADAGDSVFAAAEFPIHRPDEFVAQSYYFSIGYSLPATMGVAFARPERRVWLLIGDGAFQMTAQEISTMIRNRLNPVLIVVNNDGYLVERTIHDGPYNDIQQWHYEKLPHAFGDGALTFKVKTEEELMDALAQAKKATDQLVLINTCLPNDKGCEALSRLGKELRAIQTKRTEG